MTSGAKNHGAPERSGAVDRVAIDALFVAEERYQMLMTTAMQSLVLDDIPQAVEAIDDALSALRHVAPRRVGDIAGRWVEAAKLTPREPTIGDDDCWKEAVANTRRLRRALDNSLWAWSRATAAVDVPPNTRSKS